MASIVVTVVGVGRSCQAHAMFILSHYVPCLFLLLDTYRIIVPIMVTCHVIESVKSHDNKNDFFTFSYHYINLPTSDKAFLP